MTPGPMSPPLEGLFRSVSTHAKSRTSHDSPRAKLSTHREIYIACQNEAVFSALIVLLKACAKPSSLVSSLNSPYRVWKSISLDIIDSRLVTEQTNIKPHNASGTATDDSALLATSTSSTVAPVMIKSNSANNRVMESESSAILSSSPASTSHHHLNHLPIICELNFEILLNDAIVGRTAAKPLNAKSSLANFRREIFNFRDLENFPDHLVIRSLASTSTSSSKKSSSGSERQQTLGWVQVPVNTCFRAEIIEGWFPILSSVPNISVPDLNEPSLVGELSCAMRVEDQVILPLEDYSELIDVSSHHLMM